MNLILLFQNDYISDTEIQINDHRFEHIKEVHKAKVGDELDVGLLNGKMGTGKIKAINNDNAILSVNLYQEPPSSLPLTLIIALPRPKVTSRLLQHCTSLGVKEIIFLNSYRVEKSYWNSPRLSPEKVEGAFIEGLQQAKDTLIPSLKLEKLFKPFVEDRLPDLCKGKQSFVAHPYTDKTCPRDSKAETVLVIGPEGGFIPYEIEKLQEAGCETISLGERILKVETAVTALIAKLF